MLLVSALISMTWRYWRLFKRHTNCTPPQYTPFWAVHPWIQTVKCKSLNRSAAWKGARAVLPGNNLSCSNAAAHEDGALLALYTDKKSCQNLFLPSPKVILLRSGVCLTLPLTWLREINLIQLPAAFRYMHTMTRKLRNMFSPLPFWLMLLLSGCSIS